MHADGRMGLANCGKGKKSGLAVLEDDSDVDTDMDSLVSASLFLSLVYGRNNAGISYLQYVINGLNYGFRFLSSYLVNVLR